MVEKLATFASLLGLLLTGCATTAEAPANATPSPPVTIAAETATAPLAPTPTAGTEPASPTATGRATPAPEATVARARPSGDETTPAVAIDEPAPDSELDLGEPLVVSGAGQGLFEGNVVVRILDDAGRILAEEATILVGVGAAAGEAGTWEATLPVAAEPGTRGIVYAHSTSPVDGSIVAADAANVLFGPAESAPWVTIEDPLPYTVLAAETFTVSGRGAGLFEGNVVVEAVDAQGETLAQEATIIMAEDAGIGGEGPWTVMLTVDVPAGTDGRLVAYTTSPEDGRVVASFAIDVIFGMDGIR